MTADRVTVDAPAKVNLWLHVTGRRADGYHLLDSLVCFPNISDLIEVESSRVLSLTVDGAFAAELGAGEDNIVLRAASGLSGLVGSAGAAIRLVKRLPVASGIGGGSSDAAATLKALLRLWRAPVDAAALAELALSLGADVPACLAAPAPVFMQGVGERIAKAPSLPSCAMLLINPGGPLATPKVFGELAVKDNPPPPAFAGAKSLDALVAALSAARNDLEAPAIRLAPQIADVLAALRSQVDCRFARMSGSGATCFGLFESLTAAHAAQAQIRAREPLWWSGVGPL